MPLDPNKFLPPRSRDLRSPTPTLPVTEEEEDDIVVPTVQRADEPQDSAAVRISDMLSKFEDSPISIFAPLAGAIRGVAGAPVTRAVAYGLGSAISARYAPGELTERGSDYSDFLATIADRNRPAPGTISDVGKAVGGFLPEAVAYGLTGWLGGAAASRALAAVNNPVAKRAVGAVGSRIARTSLAIERYYQALNNPLVAAAPKPAITRAAEMLGSAVGVGATAGAETPFLAPDPNAPPGTPPPSPVRRALEMGALSLGVEAGFTLGMKAISRGAREIDKLPIFQKYVSSPTKGYLQTVEADFTRRLNRAVDRADEAIEAELFELQLQGLTPVFVPPVGQKIGKRTAAGIVKGYAAAQKKAMQTATSNRIEMVRRTHQANGNLQAARRMAGITEQDVMAGAYLSSAPTNFDSTFGSMRRLIRERFGTPDGIRKELGVAGEYFMRSTDNAVLGGFGRGNSFLEVLRRAQKNVEGVVGKKGSRSLLYAWEAGNEGPLLANLPADKRNIVQWNLDLLENGMDAMHKILVKMGAEPEIDRQALRVARYLPHNLLLREMSADVFGKKLENYLVKQGMSQAQAARRVVEITGARRTRGYQHFGSVDERRLIPGTLEEKVANGLPFIDDPWEAIAMYGLGMHNRIALSQVLGFRNELLNPMIAAVKTEAGTGAASLFTQSMESMAGLKYYDRMLEKFANTATNIQVAAKMGMSWAPNFFQPGLNNPMVFGLRNTISGIAQALTGHSPDRVKRALGFMASDFFDLGLRSNMLHDYRQGISSRLARFVLNTATPFNLEERYIRLSGAMGAHASLTETLLKASTGKLRGEQLNHARKVFEEAGLDLSTTLRNGITDEEYMTAVLRLGRRTTFAAGEGTRAIRPPKWQHPLGRLLMQFQTFSLNQGRLMRDFVFNRIAQGDRRQLARFLGIYMPVADTSVNIQNQIVNWLSGDERERPDSGVARAIEDMVYSASFGLATTIAWGMRYGSSQRFLGPNVTDAIRVSDAVLSGRFDRLIEWGMNQPTVRLYSAAGDKAYRGGEELIDIANRYNEAEAAEQFETPVPIEDEPEQPRIGIGNFRPSRSQRE